MSFVSDLFKSEGKKRTIASIFATLAAVAASIPAAAPFAPLLLKIAGVLGGVGVAHAAISGNL